MSKKISKNKSVRGKDIPGWEFLRVGSVVKRLSLKIGF